MEQYTTVHRDPDDVFRIVTVLSSVFLCVLRIHLILERALFFFLLPLEKGIDPAQNSGDVVREGVDESVGESSRTYSRRDP